MTQNSNINLFEVDFPMKAQLPQREPLILQRWEKLRHYQMSQSAGKEKFVLHDGPPYANGDIHLGHAVNKVLKDLVIRSKSLAGFQGYFKPGWDAHGLPIELNVEKSGKNFADDGAFRQECRRYAKEQLESQKVAFQRLGIRADWDNPYVTMDNKYEADTLRALAGIYQAGYLYQGSKPVFWCPSCKSALAEAEVEYQQVKSPAIYLKFPLTELSSKFFQLEPSAKVFAVIWTTTPWTIPGNLALAVAEDLEYTLLKVESEHLLVAKSLAEELGKVLQQPFKILPLSIKGKNLLGLEAQHPLIKERLSKVISAEHVTSDTGTGIVHIAPNYGLEDYQAALQNGLKTEDYLDDRAKFKSEPVKGLQLQGKNLKEANEELIKALADYLLTQPSMILHSYPHCWRHHCPLIYRSTPQWFLDVNKIRQEEDFQTELNNLQVLPAWGKERLKTMVQNRPDWCISRQRKWGVPIAFFLNKTTNKLHPDTYNLTLKVADLIEKEGLEVWFRPDLAERIGLENPSFWKKNLDVLDVWFDSGVSWLTLAPTTVADVYLEGSDQYRGWFQSSLLISWILNRKLPFKQLITHGFTVDEKGYKMSKSKGNVVAPQTIIAKYGADILRLWVASLDYTGELVASDGILAQVSETYRKLRNTLRFMLTNLADFNPQLHEVPFAQRLLLDQYAVCSLKDLQARVQAYYSSYQFHQALQELNLFCLDLSAFYFDILKDRLYTTAPSSQARRSAQSSLYLCAEVLISLLSPIIPFTSDEAFRELKQLAEDAVPTFTSYPSFPIWRDELATNLASKFQALRDLRAEVNKALEEARNTGLIRSSLQACVTLSVPEKFYSQLEEVQSELKFLLLVSKVDLQLRQNQNPTTEEGLKVKVSRSEAEKCSRCWHYVVQENEALCSRCKMNLQGLGESREFF